MSGATAPARDSSQADLIGPGDSCVPDEPRSGAKIMRGVPKSEGSLASIDNARERLDDPIDAARNQAAAFLERGDALVRRLELALQAVALLLQRLDTLVRSARSRGGRLFQATGGTLNLLFCPLSHELTQPLLADLQPSPSTVCMQPSA